MPVVAWWVLFASGVAPFVLVSGWATAAALQPASFDPYARTISSLAAHGATDRWVMTWVFAVVGVCYLVTAYGLGMVRPLARIALFVGGLAAILVALSPEPVGGTTLRHIFASGLGFTALAIWPCLGVEREPYAPWALRPAASITFTAVIAANAAWFLFELHSHGAAGLAERVVTGLQSIWPVIVAISVRRAAQRAPTHRRAFERLTVDR